MPVTLRFSKKEEKEIRETCIEINKKLVSKGKMPMKESELAHFILEACAKNVQVDKNGEMYIDV